MKEIIPKILFENHVSSKWMALNRDPWMKTWKTERNKINVCYETVALIWVFITHSMHPLDSVYNSVLFQLQNTKRAKEQNTSFSYFIHLMWPNGYQNVNLLMLNSKTIGISRVNQLKLFVIQCNKWQDIYNVLLMWWGHIPQWK